MLKETEGLYPVFDVKWVPIVKKTIEKTQRQPQVSTDHKAISLLSQKATRFVHACDYDQEGEVIGYNILEFACNNKYENSLRAKFSTLTDEEIRNSFDNLLKPSKGLAEAGISRHMIDFIYGVNLSRALHNLLKSVMMVKGIVTYRLVGCRALLLLLWLIERWKSENMSRNHIGLYLENLKKPDTRIKGSISSKR